MLEEILQNAMKSFSKTHLQYIFIFISIAILLISYTFLLVGTNLFQWVSEHINNPNTYASQSLKSVLVIMLILTPNLFDSFQKTYYQLGLMSVLMVTFLFLHVTPTNYFLFLGIIRTLYVLNQAWIQIYVPSHIRATISGLVLSITGLIDLRGTMLQSAWDSDITKAHILRWILFCLFLVFLYCAHQLHLDRRTKSTNTPPKKLGSVSQWYQQWGIKTKKNYQNIRLVIQSYPMLCIAFFLVGLDTTIVYYSYTIAKIALPHASPEAFQYAVYLGATILPVLIGPIADRHGIRLTFMITVALITVFTFVSAMLPYLKTVHPFLYDITAFLESGFAAAGCALTYSLLGSMFSTSNLFRALTIGLFINYIGSYLYGWIYYQFSDSFSTIKFINASVNLFCLLLFFYFYTHVRRAEDR